MSASLGKKLINAVTRRRKPQIDLEEYLEKLAARGQSDKGQEILSEVPMAPPIGWHKQPSMVDHIRALVRSERLREAAETSGAETFEEADDFEVDDDPVPPNSGYENDFTTAETQRLYDMAEEAAKAASFPEATPPATPPANPPADGPKPATPPKE